MIKKDLLPGTDWGDTGFKYIVRDEITKHHGEEWSNLFREAFGVQTCPVVDEKHCVYHHDYLRTAEVVERIILQKEKLNRELDELVIECSQPNWDGQDGMAILPATVDMAKSIINNLEPEFLYCTFSGDACGCVDIDWDSKKDYISASVMPSGTICMVAKGKAKNFPASEELPEEIKDAIREIIY